MKEENKKSEVAKREEETLKFWQENNIFQKSLEKNKDKEAFVFYDGPPFATGTPHYGHLIASAMKDAIPRYQTMLGKYVERQWGWDTHGLPIEQLVEKELGIKSKKEIEEMGIEKFNNLCREKIFAYIDVWNKFIPRFGRWADMDNPYITMDSGYMESGWWAFKTLHEKDLVYRDYRSMHICPRCETTLAQAEVAEGYKDIKDLAVTAKFELVDEPGTFVLAWTTTPWTLPGNVALAVGEEIDYVQNEDNLIFAKDLLESIEGISKNIKKEFKGKDLIGKSYKPLFSDYSDQKDLLNRENGWKIYPADFVNTEEGTGIVHIAPAFGEDDMNMGKEKSLPFVQHIGMDGIIKSEVKGLAGLSVKPADNPQATDVEILKLLSKKDLIFSKEKYEHSYPHCWRCETPLLNYATSSWFVSVTKVKKELLKYAKEINWSPVHIKEGRWLDWLENARDWSISRQRFWANTIPVWENEESGEKLVIGSLEELKKHTKKSGNEYFVMRHGGAKSNLGNYLDSGSDKDNHITDKGKTNVLKETKELKNKEIDLIFASPILRTKETAEIAAKELDLEVIYDERLKEKDFGEFDSLPIEEYLKSFKNLEERFTKKCPGGENRNDVRKRMGDFLYEIESKYKDKKILIISHGTPIHLLYGVAGGMDKKKIMARDDYFGTSEFRPMEFSPLPHNNLYELDLHRPYIDRIELFNDQGELFKRTPEVLDTWFDSGSVPFASHHYPFENKKKVEDSIPAHFIAEGLDQVSKWFYYQHVFASGLFSGPVFKNVIVNGIVLAEDGKKMSKRLQNYPDPVDIVDKYGADAVRLYLLASPIVRAENLNFSEEGVDEMYKKVILRLGNVLSFYKLFSGDVKNEKPELKNSLDEWIVARLNKLSLEVTKAMDEYELDKASRPFLTFIDDLSTWYIRRSRDRFKGEDKDDKNNAILTTRHVLLELSKLIAPLMPFMAENLYKKAGGEKESVHLEDWPAVALEEASQLEILEEMEKVRNVVSLGLEARASSGIKVRQPLSELKVQSPKFKVSEDLAGLIKDELNVKEVVFDSKLDKALELTLELTPELREEGQARELVRQIQSLRKEEKLTTTDFVELSIKTSKEGEAIIEKFGDDIKKVAQLKAISVGDVSGGKEIKIDDINFKLKISK